jgi:hypothetical protein
MVPMFLSVTGYGETFHRLVVQDVESVILVDALFLLDGGREVKERKKKKNSPWGWTHLAGCVEGHSVRYN